MTELDNERRVLSFKAVVTMNTTDGTEPTLRHVEQAMKRAGLQYVMPASVEAPIVIRLTDMGNGDDVHNTGKAAKPQYKSQGG